MWIHVLKDVAAAGAMVSFVVMVNLFATLST